MSIANKLQPCPVWVSCIYPQDEIKDLKVQRDFLVAPVVKNPPCNVGDTVPPLVEELKIPCAMGQLSPFATTREPVHCNKRSHVTQLRPSAAK